jgi:hypothetical protein
VFHSRSAKGITCAEVGTFDDDTFPDDYDHRPVWIGIEIPEGIHTAGRGQKYSRPPLPTIKLKDN